ncbi:MAG: AmmeMemoRadiSam system protein B [Parcubacteria group bacterium]|nr:AmmeMemoRadiSam system protein B [Parcubacteria group bacterium]
MKKFWLFFILAIIIGGIFWLANYEKRNKIMNNQEQNNEQNEKTVREPTVAGQFYSENKEELTQVINQFLNEAELPEIQKQIRALIVPHASHAYSGRVATYGFKAIQGQNIKRVILIGCSHNFYLNNAVIDGNDAWQTPLGQVDLDINLRDALIKESSLFEINFDTHKPEHSLEVEIPFLQTVLNDFKLLPILVSHELNKDDLEEISQILSEHIDDETLIIASSDMSHYPSYEQANYADQKVIDAILTGQVSNLQDTISQLEEESIVNLDTCLCAQTAVEIVMEIAQKKDNSEIKFLKYANSGDVDFGDPLRVVGYSSFAFMWDNKDSAFELNSEQKSKLLEIAKISVEEYVKEKKAPNFEIDDFLLNEHLGAFVTLKRNGQLRGCIGQFSPNIPLYQVVSQMAVSAATQDSRFTPVQSSELNDLEYEISVLSPLRKIDNWQEIELGKHGVQIKKGSRSGVFLPQVATDNNWDLDKFMGELCSQKAGLSWDCWKNDDVDLYVFTAEVFE